MTRIAAICYALAIFLAVAIISEALGFGPIFEVMK